MKGYIWSMMGKIKATGKYVVECEYITLANADTIQEARRKALSILLKHPEDKDLNRKGAQIFVNDDSEGFVGVVRLWNGKGIWYPFSTKKHPYILRKDGKLGDKFPAEYRW